MFPLTLAAAAFALPPTPETRSEWDVLFVRADPYRFVARDDTFESLGRDGLYIQLNGGLTTTTESDGPLEGSTGEEIDFEEGWMAALSIGTRFGAEDGDALAWDLGLEGLYSDQDVDEDSPEDVSLAAGYVNALADVALAERLSLYGGGGVGLAFLSVGDGSDSINDFDEEDGPFLTWQLKAGLRFWASESVSWNLGYRFLNVEDVEVDFEDESMVEEFDLETQQHIVELGVRFQL